MDALHHIRAHQLIQARVDASAASRNSPPCVLQLTLGPPQTQTHGFAGAAGVGELLQHGGLLMSFDEAGRKTRTKGQRQESIFSVSQADPTSPLFPPLLRTDFPRALFGSQTIDQGAQLGAKVSYVSN